MKSSPTRSKSRKGRFGSASEQFIDWLGSGLRVIPREDHQNRLANSQVVGSSVSLMLNESAHYDANYRVNAKNLFGDIEREGQTETAPVGRLPDHVFEGRGFVAFQYAEGLTLRPGVIGRCRARLPRDTGRDDGKFPEISQVICYFGSETGCPTGSAGSKRHVAAPRQKKARHGVRSDRKAIQDKAMAQMPPVRPAADGTCVLFCREGNRNRTRAGKPGHCHGCIVRRSAGNPRSTAFPPGARRPYRRVHACVGEPGDPCSFPAAAKPALWRKTKRVHRVRPWFRADADLRFRVSDRPA